MTENNVNNQEKDLELMRKEDRREQFKLGLLDKKK